jgi:hypothetical protein
MSQNNLAMIYADSTSTRPRFNSISKNQGHDLPNSATAIAGYSRCCAPPGSTAHLLGEASGGL